MVKSQTNQLQMRVNEFAKTQRWNHNFLLPGGVETRPGDFTSPAKNKNKIKRLDLVFEKIGLSGKSAYDIGCNEGYFSIEMSRRGANVTGLDVDAHRLEKAEFVNSIILPETKINFVCENFLTTIQNFEAADLVLCLGFLHRVPDPVTAIGRLANMGDIIIFEWKAQYTGSTGFASANFTTQKINRSDQYGTEFWLLSVDSLRAILSRHGFSQTYLLPNPGGKREILVASKTALEGIPIQNERVRLMRSAFSNFKNALKGIYHAAKGP